ncbi:MAG: DDE-type integrase/transposase/recombinase [Planctomycetes bacterium]|nr:DDE-type integrase/transposase/recombinase [Planctomycetota bacterium]
MIHHSDRGSQYASGAFREMPAAHGMNFSMSHKGEVYNDAVIDHFMGTLKRETVSRDRNATREEARQAIFDWNESRCDS